MSPLANIRAWIAELEQEPGTASAEDASDVETSLKQPAGQDLKTPPR